MSSPMTTPQRVSRNWMAESAVAATGFIAGLLVFEGSVW